VLALHQYDLIAAGLSNLGDPVPTTQFTTPIYTAPAGAVTVRAGIYMTNVWGTTGAQSLLADDFDLEATPAPGAPLFTTEPQAATAPLGGNATFSVAVSSVAPLALNSLNLFPTVNLIGTIGDLYVTERSSSPSGPFTPFSTNRITMQPQRITDYTLPISPNEYYQEVFLH